MLPRFVMFPEKTTRKAIRIEIETLRDKFGKVCVVLKPIEFLWNTQVAKSIEGHDGR